MRKGLESWGFKGLLWEESSSRRAKIVLEN